ncbi:MULTISPECIES: hypothetical protein [Brevundimonas]|uniref:hypothetical protein n=1 Tax=Brevundimonas pishanensis TaxID=2896315 RepID=UPI001FA76615|nr:hypothetical protein [Brevundimonas pishanensis]
MVGSHDKSSRAKPWLVALGIAIAAVAAVVIYNLTVFLPVDRKLDDDHRNEVATLYAYRTGLLHPSRVTLDLRDVGNAAPVDLFRVMFQSADALSEHNITEVTLARDGKAVFKMDGDEFRDMGRAYGLGENTVYLMRTLPEKLERPDGTAAYGTWSGGWLGVLTRQMDDATDFAQTWVTG